MKRENYRSFLLLLFLSDATALVENRYGDCGPASQMSEALQTWLNIIARPRDRVNLRRLQIKP